MIQARVHCPGIAGGGGGGAKYFKKWTPARRKACEARGVRGHVLNSIICDITREARDTDFILQKIQPLIVGDDVSGCN